MLVMGSFSGKMETTATAAEPAAECCRNGTCRRHGSPLAIQGKRLSLKSKPNLDNRNSAKSLLTKDVDRAKTGQFASVRSFCVQCVPWRSFTASPSSLFRHHHLLLLLLGLLLF